MNSFFEARSSLFKLLIIFLWIFPEFVSAAQRFLVPVDFPGVPIAHSEARTGIYLDTPAILVLDKGDYLVSHDSFGPISERNGVAIYKSLDRGKSWSKVAQMHDQYYSSLFLSHGIPYIVGLSRYEGVPVIRRSMDGGRTWSNPVDADHGLLASGGKFFSAAVPVVVANNRIWHPMETIRSNGVWAGVMSASVNSDLMKASSWTFSEGLGPDPNWLGGNFHGWLEGNVVVDPSGKLIDLLRVYYNALPEKAAIISIDSNGKTLVFDSDGGFIDMPGGGNKFTVRYDATSRRYWSLTNAVTDSSYSGTNFERARNTLALVSSRDLRAWTVCRIVLHSDDEKKHGFQYADWVVDGDDIVPAVRTAFDDDTGGAHSSHDSNYITFLRVSEFRSAPCR